MTKRQNDIERYLRGEMTPAEMHALEKEALADPFLSDALEGAQEAGAGNFLLDLNELRSSLIHRNRAHRPKIISIWNWSIGIAAGLILLALSGVYIISNLKQQAPIANNENTIATDDYALSRAPSTDTLDIQYPIEAERREAAMARQRALARVERVALAETRARRQPQREVEANLTEPPVISRSRSQRDEVSTQPLSITNHVVRGKVVAREDGSGLPGVNVTVNGTNEGTITNQYGEYEIKTTSAAKNLEFSFIGMKSERVDIRNLSEINVQMTRDNSMLSEIVVTGDAVTKDDDGDPFKMAIPSGGKEAYTKYLETEMTYPKQALDNKIEGNVMIQFTVDHNGQLSDFKVLKGLGYGLDDEVIRLVKEGPAWSPSTKDDKPVAEKVRLGLKFNIPDDKQ